MPPKIELKNVKISPSLSEETTAYTATIYVDGKKVGTTSNHGTGGSDNIHFTDREAMKRVDAFIKTLPPLPPSYQGDKPMEMDRDLYFAQLLAKQDVEKQERKMCKGKIVFRLKGDEKDLFRTIKGEFNPAIKEQLVAHYKKNNLEIEEILNEKFV